MRTGLGAQAYTIVEVLIFLAVSSALFAVVARTISGQTTRSQFTETVRNFESRLLDIGNDVATGYYAANNNFSCTVNGAGKVQFTGVSTERGKNGECIVVGQVLNFDTADVPADSFQLISLAGARYLPGTTTEVQTLAETQPDQITGSAQIESIGPVKVESVTYEDNAVSSSAEAIALTTTFGKYSGAKLNSGDISVNLIPFSAPGPLSVGNKITNALTASPPTLVLNPTNGIKICVSGGINQFATITLGGGGQRLSTKVAFRDGACP